MNTWFWSQYRKSPNGCWEWTGAKFTNGYGAVHWLGQVRYAHRVAYWLAKGRLPAGRFCVCHSCDNRACGNPDHLRLDSDRGNIHEAIRKGRFTHHRKLTPANVDCIKSCLARGDWTLRQLAARYGVSYGCIRSIATGRTWSIPNLQPPEFSRTH